MTTGEKLQAIANSEYYRFVNVMNNQNIDLDLALLILDNMKSKLLEQKYRSSLEAQVKQLFKENSEGD